MKNKIWTYVRLIVYFLIILVLIFCMVNKIYLKCNYVETFGITCPACGATRATLSIFKGKFLTAIEYNPFYTLVVFPFFVIFMVEDLYIIIKRNVLKTSETSLVEVLFGGMS